MTGIRDLCHCQGAGRRALSLRGLRTAGSSLAFVMKRMDCAAPLVRLIGAISVASIFVRDYRWLQNSPWPDATNLCSGHESVSELSLTRSSGMRYAQETWQNNCFRQHDDGSAIPRVIDAAGRASTKSIASSFRNGVLPYAKRYPGR